MKMITRTIATVILLWMSVASAQDPTVTIDQQFTEVIEGSNNYQQFKVIEKVKMSRLQANTKEKISSLRTEIASLKSEMETKQTAALKVRTDLENTQQALEITKSEKDSIVFLGSQMQKGTYQTMMWSIVGLLFLGLLFFIYKFKNSHTLTKEAQHKLDETEAEFDNYRRKALEKEQKLGRQLQDERNKALKATKG